MFISTDDDGDLSGGIIAGVITGAVILFSILIISAIIICRKVFFQPMYVYTRCVSPIIFISHITASHSCDMNNITIYTKYIISIHVKIVDTYVRTCICTYLYFIYTVNISTCTALKN